MSRRHRQKGALSRREFPPKSDCARAARCLLRGLVRFESLVGSVTLSGTQTPARFGSEALEKIEIVGPLRRLANQFIEPLRILADENAPPVGFDPVEDNGRRARRTDGGLLAKATFALGNYLPDVLI